MKTNHLIVVPLFLFIGCSNEKASDHQNAVSIEQKIRQQSETRTAAEMHHDLKSFLSYYASDAIVMPEYQLTLTGTKEVAVFYDTLFHRQEVKSLQRKIVEFIHLGKTVIEIGTFHKEYTDLNLDSLQTQNGKYWNIWLIDSKDSIKLKGEAYGYFHPIQNPEVLTFRMNKPQPDESELKPAKKIPFELKAYNALMEKGVRTRDGILRSEFFTNDASIMPFADTTVTGIENIRPYLIAYSSRGSVVIDSIMCYTYAFDDFGDHIIEYDMFKVKWSVPNYSGRTEGKGIRIWRRQEDHSLKLYREIGTHNHIQ